MARHFIEGWVAGPGTNVLPKPHGGRLVDQVASERERIRREEEIRDLPKISPFIDQVYDAEKIAFGAYSPIDGFMDETTLDSVVKSTRLPSDLPWPMPIFLAPTGTQNEATVAQIAEGEDLALLDSAGNFFALMRVSQKFPLDPKAVAESVYATTDPSHPNVADLFATGRTAIAGKVTLLRRLEIPHFRYERTPAETRSEFERRGWKNVVAYQTRNVPHTAHEYLQRCTLEREEVDGLFVHPVVGRLKKGDYRPDVIVEAYETLLKHYYPATRLLLGSLTITMRYAGPKGALFFGIVRKNYGCGIYIVGRDQAGVGSYYDPYACHRIFDEFPIDVVPLRYFETFYCQECAGMATERTCAHPATSRVNTSQTRIRKALESGEALPREIIRPEVARILGRGDVLLPS